MASRLVELRVRNLGVIDDVTVDLGPGMTALTGETGAGKTLLVEALGLLLGGRADPSVVRAGADEATVEGRFVVTPGPSSEAPGDGVEVTLARAVVSGGRSRAWIDGRMATVGALSETAGTLIELHGQHQHHTLSRTAAQRQVLDAFGGIDLSEWDEARQTLHRLADESAALGGDARERARGVDLLRYQIGEIEEAGIEDDAEEERLQAEEDRLADAAAHRLAATAALEAVAGHEDGPGGDGALDRLADAAGSLGGRVPLAALDARVRSAMADLADLATELRSVVETWEDDPERLEAVRNRRELFHQLRRKYGSTLGEVLSFAADARARLGVIEAEEERSLALDAEMAAVRDHRDECACAVAAARRRAAPRLASRIESTLHDLAMPSARFAIEVDGDGAADQVTFLLGANRGEPLLPLAKAASGGELSRTMLAIRLAVADPPGVTVFDEVDAGVGGAAATAVGAALADLGRHGQVLVVTHLAQVAAQADRQLAVRKSEESGRTRSEVSTLDDEGRVVELSRMLSGHPDSASAQRHARELLEDQSPGSDRR
ncbi:MAG: DNA repair protein RecN [Acidimicrobiales bacterium]